MPLDVVTVRIPELPLHSVLTLADRLAIWSNEDNKTRNTDLSLLRTLILTGANQSASAPVTTGASYIVRVGPAEDGTNTFIIPELANKTFVLRREGFGALPPDTYEVLNAGGFRILNGALLTLNEVFELEIYELQGQPQVIAGSTALIKGTVVVPTNFTLNPTHMGKLIQLRALGNSVTLTLPSVADVPVNTILLIETVINNTKQAKIQPVGGQFIYLGNDARSAVYLGLGEYLWLYRDEDGWIMLNDNRNILDVGTPQWKWKVGLNETVADGRTVNRIDFPRLWDYVLTLGASLVDEATWQTIVGGAMPYRGTFSRGDGSTTFRLPDLRNMGIRGLKNVGGVDPERTQNIPGGYQRHQLEQHDHLGNMGNGSGSGPGAIMPDYDPQDGNISRAKYRTDATGGSETRMENIGFLPIIKI